MNDEIRIIPVTTKKGLKTFIQFHYDLYRGHKFAIPFLRFDEMNTLDPIRNFEFQLYKNGLLTNYLLWEN